MGQPKGITITYSRGLELNGSHFLDLMFSLLGDDAEVDLTISEADRQAPNPSFLLRTKTGFTIVFAGLDVPYHSNDIVCTTESGRLSLLSGGCDARVEVKEPNGQFPGFFRLKETTSEILDAYVENNFSEALADLIMAFETNASPASNLRTARNAQEVIARIRCLERNV